MLDYTFSRPDLSYKSPHHSRFSYDRPRSQYNPYDNNFFSQYNNYDFNWRNNFGTTTHANSIATPDPPRFNNYSLFRDNNNNNNSNSDFEFRAQLRGYSASPNNRQLNYRDSWQNYFRPFGRQPQQQQQYTASDYTDIDCILEPQGTKGGLYLGNIKGASNIFMLKSKSIGAVVTLLRNSGIRYNPIDIEHFLIEIDDAEDENIARHFDAASSFIQQQLNYTNVFVHCYAGISRSSSIIIAYLMNRNQWDFQTAYQFVKSKRKIIDPNPEFIRQLKNYESKFNNNYSNFTYSPEKFIKNSYDQSYRGNIYNRFQY